MPWQQYATGVLVVKATLQAQSLRWQLVVAKMAVLTNVQLSLRAGACSQKI